MHVPADGDAFTNDLASNAWHQTTWHQTAWHRPGGNAAYVEAAGRWSGLYLGANSGGAVARNPTSATATEGTVLNVAETFHLSPAGYFGGAQIGYN
jgi:hypothetical protein